VTPREWGVTTQRGDTVFVHVLNWPDRLLALPDFGARVVKASLLKSGERIEVVQAANGLTLALPSAAAEEPDRVIVLAERGFLPEEIDQARAEEQRRQAEKEMADLSSHDPEFAVVEAKLEESIAMINIHR